MTRIQKLVTSFFLLMALAGFGLRLVALFAAPPDQGRDRPVEPRHTAIGGRA